MNAAAFILSVISSPASSTKPFISTLEKPVICSQPELIGKRELESSPKGTLGSIFVTTSFFLNTKYPFLSSSLVDSGKST